MTTGPYSWRAIGDTTRGASHERSGLPNQDWLDWYPKVPGTTGPPLVLAVADGHGSSKCFRSDRGSKIATLAAKQAVKQVLLKTESDFSDLSRIKRLLEERLPRDMVQNWQTYVRRDITKMPLKPEELDALEARDGARIRQKLEANPALAYGATLLVTLVTEAFIAYFQLGDGDILVVSDSGEVTRPIAHDERLFANETTSLSGASAWTEFQTSFQPIAGAPPAMILMSTDGYSNSFRDEDSFLKVGADILEVMRSDGVQKVRGSLREWLSEASKSGSGDDISLGIVYREDAFSPEAQPDTTAAPAAEPAPGFELNWVEDLANMTD